jgi:hypothetical protein
LWVYILLHSAGVSLQLQGVYRFIILTGSFDFSYIWNAPMSLLPSIYPHIFSIRSPGPVSPRDVECEGFDLTYPRIASTPTSPTTSLDYDVDRKVDESIQSFLMTLSQIGPELLSVSLLVVFLLLLLHTLLASKKTHTHKGCLISQSFLHLFGFHV